MLISVPEDDDDAEGIEYGAYDPYSPQCIAYYFDVEAKLWKPLASVARLEETYFCFCTERIGNYLFVAAHMRQNVNLIHRYDVVNNS